MSMRRCTFALLVATALASAQAKDARKSLELLDALIEKAREPGTQDDLAPYRRYASKELQDINRLSQKLHEQCDELSRINTEERPWEPKQVAKPNGEPIRVALAFFGVMRSLSSTICNMRARILRPLEASGVQFEAFVHTFNVQKVNNARNAELNQTLLLGEWRLLPNLKGAVVSSQEQYLSDDNVQLMDKYLPSTYDPRATKFAWGDEKTAASLRNLLRQYYSLNSVTALWKQRHAEKPFDVVFCLRPDVAYLETLSPDMVRSLVTLHAQKERQVWASPSWSSGKGRNDRMAFGTPSAMERYGTRLERAEEYVRDTLQPLHAEKFLFYDMRMGQVDFVRGAQGHKSPMDPSLDFEERFFKLRFLRIRSGCVRNDKRCKCNAEGLCGPFVGPLVRSNWTVENRDCKFFAAESPALIGASATWLFLPPWEAPEELSDARAFQPSAVPIDETDRHGRGGRLCADSWVATVSDSRQVEKEKERDDTCPTYNAAISDIYPPLQDAEGASATPRKEEFAAHEFGGHISRQKDRDKIFEAAAHAKADCPFGLAGADGLSEACQKAKAATSGCKLVVYSQAFEVEDVEYIQRPRNTASASASASESVCWILFVLDKYTRRGDSSFSPTLSNLLDFLSKQKDFGMRYTKTGVQAYLGPWQLVVIKSSQLPYGTERERSRTYFGNPSFSGSEVEILPNKMSPWYVQHETGINGAALKHLATSSCFSHAQATVWVHPRLTLAANPSALVSDMTGDGKACLGVMEMNTKVVKGSLENLLWKISGFLDDTGKPQREFEALSMQKQVYAEELYKDRTAYDPWLLKVTDNNAFNQHVGDETRNLNLTDSGLLVTSNSKACGSFVRRMGCILFGESHCFGVHDFVAVPTMIKAFSNAWRYEMDKAGVEQLVHVAPYLEDGVTDKSLLHWDVNRSPSTEGETTRVAIRREFLSGICPAFRGTSLKGRMDPRVSFGCGVLHRQERVTSFLDTTQYEEEIDAVNARCESCAEISLRQVRKTAEKLKGSCANVVFTGLFYPTASISQLVKTWMGVKPPQERMPAGSGSEPPSTCHVALLRSSSLSALKMTLRDGPFTRAGIWHLLGIDDAHLPYSEGSSKGSTRLLRLLPGIAHKIFPWASAVVYVNTLKKYDSNVVEMRSYEEVYNGDHYWQQAIDEIRGSGACIGFALFDRLKLRRADLDVVPELDSHGFDRTMKMMLYKYLYPEFSHELLPKKYHTHLFLHLGLDWVSPKQQSSTKPARADVHKLGEADDPWAWFISMYDEVLITLGQTSSRCAALTATFGCALFQESHCTDGPYGFSLHHTLRSVLGVPFSEQEVPVLLDFKRRPSVYLFPRHKTRARSLADHVENTDAIDLRKAGLYDEVIRMLRLPDDGEAGSESLTSAFRKNKACYNRMVAFRDAGGLVRPSKLTDVLICVDNLRLESEAAAYRSS